MRIAELGRISGVPSATIKYYVREDSPAPQASRRETKKPVSTVWVATPQSSTIFRARPSSSTWRVDAAS